MKLQSFVFIGGGRITRLLLQALKQKNTLPEKVLVADPDEKMRTRIKAIDAALIQCVKQNIDVLNVDIKFLAVHPPIVKEIAAEISGKIAANTLVMSFIPVISIEKLSVMLGGVKKLMRMIPNAPSIMHKGYNPVAYSNNITTDEKQQLQNLFSNWGEAPEVDKQKLESFAIVTAMVPSYFWFQWLKLQELGKQFGISDSEVIKAMPAMLHGATETLFESNLLPNNVLDLIPVCLLRDDELAIQNIFNNKLTELYAKLAQK